MVAETHAAVIMFTTPISVPNSFGGLYLNLLTGASGATGGSTPGWDFNAYNVGTGLSFFWSTFPGQAGGVAGATSGPYLALAPGASISSASTFTEVTGSANTAAFQTAGSHVLGFRFYNDSTSAINYGFMTLTTGAGGTGFPLTIDGWSIENTGAAITVSAVPEESTALMLSLGGLALGAANLGQQRRQRRQFAAK